MAITSYSQSWCGGSTIITVTSDLGGEPWFHWWLDGRYRGWTRQSSKCFHVAAGSQVRVLCVDTLDEAFDPISDGPDMPSRSRRVFWTRSPTTGVVRHRVEQALDRGQWTPVGGKWVGRDWSQELVTPTITDLVSVKFRVLAIDGDGYEAAETLTDRDEVVGYPDAPNFEIAYNEGTNRVAFSLA